MSSEMTWRVVLKDVAVNARVGIHPHEQDAQRLLVSVEAEGVFPYPAISLADCLNYEDIHSYIASWEKQGHTPFLETLAVQLLTYIFTKDSRVSKVRVAVGKPDIFSNCALAGVEATWLRADYERLKN